MKKIFSLVIAVLIIFSSFSIYAEAASGSLGTNFFTLSMMVYLLFPARGLFIILTSPPSALT